MSWRNIVEPFRLEDLACSDFDDSIRLEVDNSYPYRDSSTISEIDKEYREKIHQKYAKAHSVRRPQVIYSIPCRICGAKAGKYCKPKPIGQAYEWVHDERRYEAYVKHFIEEGNTKAANDYMRSWERSRKKHGRS